MLGRKAGIGFLEGDRTKLMLQHHERVCFETKAREGYYKIVSSIPQARETHLTTFLAYAERVADHFFHLLFKIDILQTIGEDDSWELKYFIEFLAARGINLVRQRLGSDLVFF